MLMPFTPILAHYCIILTDVLFPHQTHKNNMEKAGLRVVTGLIFYLLSKEKIAEIPA
jgi:hypothetical protein